MNDKDLIARLAAENFELRDKLEKQTELSNYWYDECQKCRQFRNSISVVPQTMEETVKALEDIND